MPQIRHYFPASHTHSSLFSTPESTLSIWNHCFFLKDILQMLFINANLLVINSQFFSDRKCIYFAFILEFTEQETSVRQWFFFFQHFEETIPLNSGIGCFCLFTCHSSVGSLSFMLFCNVKYLTGFAAVQLAYEICRWGVQWARWICISERTSAAASESRLSSWFWFSFQGPKVLWYLLGLLSL